MADTPTEATRTLKRGAAALVDAFEHDLDLPFERAKACVIGSTPKAVELAVRYLGPYAGIPARAISTPTASASAS